MKKNTLLNLCLMLLALNVCAAGGVRQDIDKVCSFSFPAKPQYGEVDGWKEYLFQTDSCRYLVEVRPLSKSGVVVDTASLYAFFQGVVKSTIRGYKATLLGQKPVIVGGLRGYQVEYIKPPTAPNLETVSTRMLLLGNQVVKYSFSTPYRHYIAYAVLKDSFFQSFALYKGEHIAGNIDSAALSHDTIPTPVFDSVATQLHISPVHTELVKSNTLHFAISFVVCILVLLGLLYAIVRWRKQDATNK